MKLEPINVNTVTKKMTLTVNLAGLKVFKAKLAIGLFFIKLAALIIGCGIEIVNDDKAD